MMTYKIQGSFYCTVLAHSLHSLERQRMTEREMLIEGGRREVRVRGGAVVSSRQLGPAVLNGQQPG